MRAAAADPEKVWIYGRLNVSTQNNPSCHVGWRYHVAPTLQVNTANGLQTWVVDPSLFPEAVPLPTWVGVQGDPNATVESSNADVFYEDRGHANPQYDPTYSQTDQLLITYRNNLKLRSVSAEGPPPYFACMVRGPGVQWFGSLAPNQARTWFTWGWPSAWHVFWTVMPLTECPGGPRLKLKAEVERATPTESTYWLTITNLTPDPIKFEGRYNVLSR